MELISREEAIKTARMMIDLTADEREYEIRAIPTIEERKEGMWIPVSERLPLNDSLVLVTRKGEKGYEPNIYYYDIARYYADLKEWTQDWDFLGDPTSKVIAWMPLPEPWKGE